MEHCFGMKALHFQLFQVLLFSFETPPEDLVLLSSCKTHPEEEVEDEDQVLDAFIHRHADVSFPLFLTFPGVLAAERDTKAVSEREKECAKGECVFE